MGFESSGYGDKLGNRYEARWVVRQMLFVLGGRLRTITLECVGDDERGVDLWIETNDGKRCGEQCKGEHGSKSQWSMADLHSAGILEHLRFQLDRNGRHRFTLISSVHARSLLDLSRRARDSTGSADDFYVHQVSTNKDLAKEFRAFCRYLDLNPSQPGDLESAYRLLEKSDFHQFFGDAQDQLFLEELASHYVDGQPSVVISVLADFAGAQLRKTLTADDIIRHLTTKGFQFHVLTRDPRIASKIDELRSIFRDSFTGQLAGGELISRSHASKVLLALDDNAFTPIVVVHGRAGFGKSGILLELTSLLEDKGVPYLPFRLDRQIPAGTPRHFGETWGLPDSPALCLSQLVGDKQGVLVLDQIDAMRWTSGHASDPWLTCQALIRQALRLGNVRVVIACRTFDLENDPQFSAWANTNELEKVEVGDLDDSIVRKLVGNHYDSLTGRQRRLLLSVQHLAMWLQLTSMSRSPTGFVSATDLLRAFWKSRYEELARKNIPTEDVRRLLDTLLDHFTNSGTLSAPHRSIQPYYAAASELQSLNVIRVTQNSVSFCHQSYSDYLLAIRLMEEIARGNSTIFEWLGSKSHQSLFRREQLRIVLTFMRDENEASYIATLRSLLESDDVRFHLKHLCLQVLGQANVPSVEEGNLVVQLVNDPAWREHVTSQVLWGNDEWMQDRNIRGTICSWLSANDDGLVDHALWLLRSVEKACGDLIAEMIEPFEQELSDKWRARFEWMFVRHPHDDSDRLFSFRLRQIARGRLFDYTDWAKLADTAPQRCLTLLVARLQGLLYQLENPNEKRDASHRSYRPTSVFEIEKSEDMDALRREAEANPEFVCDTILPLISQIISLDRKQIREIISSVGYAPRRRRGYRFLSPLFDLLISSGQTLAKRDFPALKTPILQLSGIRSKFSQRVALEWFLAAQDEFADDAVQWLLERPARLQLGHRRSPKRFMPARRLIKRFAGACSEGVYRELERMLVSYHPKDEWESMRRRHDDIMHGWCRDYEVPNLYGMAHFFLLTALPANRMSDSATRARGIAQQKFSLLFPHLFDRRPRSTGGAVCSPIPKERLHLVSDRLWLDTFRRYARTRNECKKWKQIDADSVAESSCETFSRDLGVIAKRQPRRFARLALKVPADASPAYLQAIMQAFESTSPPENATAQELFDWEPVPASEIELVLKHAQGLGHAGLEHSFCALVENRPEAGWSEWALGELCRLSKSHPRPKPYELPVSKKWEERSSHDLEVVAINYVRGPAAQAIHSVLCKDKSQIERFRSAIDSLCADPHPGVRVAAIGICLPLWSIDRESAIDRFLTIFECDDDRILPTRYAVLFVNLAQKAHLRRIEPLIARMVKSEIEEVNEHGAARVTFVCIRSGSLAELAKECLNGTVSQRKGVAATAAEYATDPECGAECRELLSQLLNDPEMEVRQRALSVFRRVDVLGCKDMEGFVHSYVSSKAFQDHPTELLHSLEDFKGSLISYREELFAICQALSDDLALESRNASARAGYEAEKVPSLLLRLYEQAQGKGLIETQDRCLDTWDRLLKSRVGTIRGLIEKIDL